MAAAEAKKPGWAEVFRAMGQKKTGYMALFGFASGLPFSLFLGTLYAWLSEAEVDLETMGVFSLIGLAYAFQFMWSPLIDKVNIAGFRRLGRRKQWMVPAQLLLGAILVTLSILEPKTQLGWFSLLAGIGAFASATQDIAINAWRIDNADEKATLDILSTVYQMGYRLAALAGGAFGLILAARIGWPQTYMLFGAMLLTIGALGLFAPDSDTNSAEGAAADDEQLLALRKAGELRPEVRARALGVVGLLWAASIGVLLTFMYLSLASAPEDRPNPTEFTLNYGPWIIVATVVVPALIAGWLSAQKRDGKNLLT
ncbi:MAG: MFS transporter, partial [Pseudomonadota bacterium]